MNKFKEQMIQRWRTLISETDEKMHECYKQAQDWAQVEDRDEETRCLEAAFSLYSVRQDAVTAMKDLL